MPVTLSSHALVRIGAVQVDIVMDCNRASVVGPETGRLLISVKRRTDLARIVRTSESSEHSHLCTGKIRSGQTDRDELGP